MKKIILLTAIALTLLSACGNSASGASKLSAGDMLDNDTGTIYSLGDPRSRFDDAFGYMGIEESEDEVEYLSGVLIVTFSDGAAIEIECDEATDRFSFLNFDFSTDISKIKGRYELFEVSGYDFYSRYYDKEDNDTSLYDAYISHTLMVRDGDLMDMKDGDYLSYTITLENNSLY